MTTKERFLADGLPPEFRTVVPVVPSRVRHIEVPVDRRPVEREPSMHPWISSTGETGFGRLPRRIPKRVAYDDSPPDYNFPH